VALDWFSGLVGYDGSALKLGRVIAIGAGGDIEWESDRWRKAEGSYGSSVQVSRDAATGAMRDSGFHWNDVVLRVSGNPTKFLQGHNVFGPSVSQLGTIVQALVRGFPEELRPADAGVDELPALHRSRVDEAVMVDLGGHQVVHEWLRAAETATRSRHGRAMASGSTVYWGKSSRRWSLKAYCKFCELADHPPNDGYNEFREFTEGLLRIELTLRRPELKERDTLSDHIVWEFFEKVVVGVTDLKADAMQERIRTFTGPVAARLLLSRWLDGHDVRWEVNRMSFWRYRKLVMEEFGVDLSLPRSEQWDGLSRVGFDVEYLKSREVKKVPAGLQHRLFRTA
jgi:hypothetical protein